MDTEALMSLLHHLDPEGIVFERDGEVVLDLRIDRDALDEALAQRGDLT